LYTILSAKKRIAQHSSTGREPSFVAWYKEWNYESFAEGATYIIGWVAIMLGIGPHSSTLYGRDWILIMLYSESALSLSRTLFG